MNECGICGKDYQSCSHYTKAHLSWMGLPLCGGSGGFYYSFDQDWDSADLCKRCQVSLAKACRDDFDRFEMLMRENSR
jgi:hypothetical protein